tara:strand:+ start:14087 stop:14314 length:228 start_codon:yes stop_codon:yes gene_type:complete
VVANEVTILLENLSEISVNAATPTDLNGRNLMTHKEKDTIIQKSKSLSKTQEEIDELEYDDGSYDGIELEYTATY